MCILKAANALIGHNEKLFDKKLWSDLGHGDPITVTISKDSEKEAENVVMKPVTTPSASSAGRSLRRRERIAERASIQRKTAPKHIRSQAVPPAPTCSITGTERALASCTASMAVIGIGASV